VVDAGEELVLATVSRERCGELAVRQRAQSASTPPTSQAASTAAAEPRSRSNSPLVVKTPVPTMLATTSVVAVTPPTFRSSPPVDSSSPGMAAYI
jgi:hypothetical protein